MKHTQPIFNFYEIIRENPAYYRQLACGDLLMAEYTCPLEGRIQAIWAQHNYFIYVFEGKKTWHTADGVFAMEKGSCAFVRKGAAIVEQFFDTPFCLILFFLPDEFICETLRPRLAPFAATAASKGPVVRVEADITLSAFFHSMLPFFTRMQPPDDTLLELKFRELLLHIADNPRNRELLTCLSGLLHKSADTALRQVMEDNFCYNLSLETYAQLCNRSLSAFKRDFQKLYGATPGKWLTDKRLAHARLLLTSTAQTVSEVAYASGFENLSHFSRAFRQKFGVSPANLRLQTAG